MGDVDRGDAELTLERLDLVAHALADAGVEIGERLVEQQDPRAHGERPAERDPLALAARELGHRPLAELVQAEQRQDFPHSCSPLGP